MMMIKEEFLERHGNDIVTLISNDTIGFYTFENKENKYFVKSFSMMPLPEKDVVKKLFEENLSSFELWPDYTLTPQTKTISGEKFDFNYKHNELEKQSKQLNMPVVACIACGAENSLRWDKHCISIDDKKGSYKDLSFQFCEDCGDVSNVDFH